MKKIIFALLFISAVNGDSLYNSSFFKRSGILHKSINTGIPNYVDGSKLLHWRGYITKSIHIVFDKDDFKNFDIFDYLANLIELNRDRIKYITIIGYSSSIIDDENRVTLTPWANMWHSIGGEHRVCECQAIYLVNQRLKEVYEFLLDKGISAHRIYNENRLDREPIATEATKLGRLLNNRIDLRIYSTKPLRELKSCYLQ